MLYKTKSKDQKRNLSLTPSLPPYHPCQEEQRQGQVGLFPPSEARVDGDKLRGDKFDRSRPDRSAPPAEPPRIR